MPLMPNVVMLNVVVLCVVALIGALSKNAMFTLPVPVAVAGHEPSTLGEYSTREY